MLAQVAGLGEGREQAADLAGGEPDHVTAVRGGAVMIMRLAHPGKLSTGGRAPFWLVSSALALGFGYWYLTIARSASPRT